MIFGITPLLSVLRNLSEMVCLCVLFLCLDRPRLDLKKTIFCYSVFILIMTVIGTVWVLLEPVSYQYGCTALLFGISALFFLCFSQNNAFQVLYNLSLQVFVLMLLLFAEHLVTRILFRENPWIDLGIRFAYMILLSCAYWKWFRKPFREITEHLRIQWMGLCFISLLGSVLIVFFAVYPTPMSQRSGSEQIVFTGFCILQLLVHFVMLYTMYQFQKELTGRQELELTAIHNHMLQKELKLMQDQIEDSRRIRHDIRHHNLLIEEYARKGEIENLLHYLGQQEQVTSASLQDRICANTTVNNIVSVYVRRANQKGIRLDLDISLPQETGIRDNDFIAILGNALENALHGCERYQKENPWIQVSIHQKKRHLAIQVSNTCPSGILFRNGLPVRKDGKGIGVDSMQRSVNAYQGELDFKIEGERFVVRVLLPMTIFCE